ncbi:ABC transporter permease subunit [Alphaproteobacteria bacterium HT1-32]|nr:ABC transporter permease subunit [Alphaproteobacteria bacterium HT1-32]
MFSYLLRRLFIMIPTLLAISFIVFVVIQLPPGDYLTTLVEEYRSRGEQVPLEEIAFLKREYGFGEPFLVQYIHWLGGMMVGDFGHSFSFDLPVSEVVGNVLGYTVLVEFTTVLFVYLVSFPIGIYSATHQYSWTDHGISLIGYIGYAVPNFLLAIVLMYYSKLWFGAEIGGLMDIRFEDQPWSWDKAVSVAQHLWIPVVVIGTSGTAAMIRRLRANLLDELRKQYVVTGRAKGLPKTRLLLKYPVRMSLNPFIADIGSLLPEIVSGSAIVGIILSLPTTGPLLLNALLNQDMYLAGSFLMFLSVLVVVGMFVSDIMLAWLDPRIRLDGGLQR